MFDTGDKIFCKSMKQNLIVGCRMDEYCSLCIDISCGMPEAKRFGTFILNNCDLELGWKTKEELVRLRNIK